jgi:hypothetical protein
MLNLSDVFNRVKHHTYIPKYFILTVLHKNTFVLSREILGHLLIQEVVKNHANRKKDYCY